MNLSPEEKTNFLKNKAQKESFTQLEILFTAGVFSVSEKKDVGKALNKLKDLVKSKLSFNPEGQINKKLTSNNHNFLKKNLLWGEPGVRYRGMAIRAQTAPLCGGLPW